MALAPLSTDSHFRDAFRETDDFFSHFLGGTPFGGVGGALMNPRAPRGDLSSVFAPTREGTAINRFIPVDVTETDNAYQLKADVPGVKKEEITLEVDGNVIRIGTKRESKESEEEESPDKRWHRSERREYSEFQQRALRMPENTDFSSLQATYDNGTLCLDVKKKHDSKDQKKKIAIK